MQKTVTATLAAAAALVAAAGCTPAGQPAAGAQPAMQHAGTEKCFGVATRSHNDCASVYHSCAGLSQIDADPHSFLYLPVGMCGKISGGKLMAT